MKTYSCLSKNIFENEEYKLVPIRYKDRYEIMHWRNAQVEILRQNNILTEQQQDKYFDTVVNALFDNSEPGQLLWSFLLNDELIGYGGLVHIDWHSKNAEISFLINNERNLSVPIFKKDWKAYLEMLNEIAFETLKFNKLYTYAYNIRDYYFEVMYEMDYIKEAHLKNHILINNELKDILILSKFNQIK